MIQCHSRYFNNCPQWKHTGASVLVLVLMTEGNHTGDKWKGILRAQSSTPRLLSTLLLNCNQSNLAWNFHPGPTFYQTLTKHQHRILTKQVVEGGAHWYMYFFLVWMIDKESAGLFRPFLVCNQLFFSITPTFDVFIAWSLVAGAAASSQLVRFVLD